MRKRGVLICLILLFIVTVGFPGEAFPKKVKSVKIGLLLPLSGVLGVQGVHARQGIEFAIEEVNKAGGIKSLGGAEIEYIIADEKSMAAPSVTEYERLATAKKVSVVIGPGNSSGIKAVFPYADRYRVPFISFAGAPFLRETFWFGRNMQVGPLDVGDAEIGGVASLIQEFNLSVEKIAVISYDVAGGPIHKMIIPDVMKKFKMNPDKIVMNGMFSSRAEDLRPLALKVKATGAQVVFAGVGGEHMILWAKACHAVDYKPLIVSNWTGTLLDETWHGLGEKMARATIGRPGWIGLSYWHPDIDYKPLQDYLNRFTAWAKGKGLPERVEQYHVIGAQLVYFVHRALEMAGSRKPTEINKAMWKVSFKKDDPHFIWMPAMPELKFDRKTNYPVHRQLLNGFWDENGKVQIAYPKEMRTAAPRKPGTR